MNSWRKSKRRVDLISFMINVDVKPVDRKNFLLNDVGKLNCYLTMKVKANMV